MKTISWVWKSTLISLINVESTFTNLEKFHPPQKENPPSTFIDVINSFHPPRLLQPPRLHYLIFSTPFFTVYKQFNESFLTEMKLIQEIRLELVSLDPFLLSKYVRGFRWFLDIKVLWRLQFLIGYRTLILNLRSCSL